MRTLISKEVRVLKAVTEALIEDCLEMFVSHSIGNIFQTFQTLKYLIKVPAETQLLVGYTVNRMVMKRFILTCFTQTKITYCQFKIKCFNYRICLPHLLYSAFKLG